MSLLDDPGTQSVISITEASPDRFEKLKFVTLAVPKDDHRIQINYLYVEDGLAVGTDGHRLHVAPTDLDAGYYTVRKRAKSVVELAPANVGLKYVDYQRLLPEDGIAYQHFELLVPMDIRMSQAAYYAAKEFNVCANVTYLRDAVSYFAGSPGFAVYEEVHGPLYIDHGEGVRAVVMPMRI